MSQWFVKRVIPACIALLCGIHSAAGIPLDSPDLKWNLGKHGWIEERDGRRYLRVKVEKEFQDHVDMPNVGLNLREYAGKDQRFSIRLRARNVLRPSRPWFGLKFMLNYPYPDGAQAYPGAMFTYEKKTTSFDWKEFSFFIPEAPVSARLYLGLQGSAGEVEYDLSSFRVTEEDSFLKKSNLDYKAEYTSRLSADKKRRGMQITRLHVSEADLKKLLSWNVNLVRYQIASLGSGDAEYFKNLENNLQTLEKLLKLCGKYGIKVIVDLHQLPGGDGPEGKKIFFEPKYRDQFLKIWRGIARRFHGNPNVWAYDLMNEPGQRSRGIISYWDLQKKAAEEIRSIDPDVPVIITPLLGAPGGFRTLSPLKMKDVLYTVHVYEPLIYTHQGVYPQYRAVPDLAYPVKGNDREALRKAIAPVRRFQMEHNARIFVGEFSVVAWAEGGAQYLRDAIGLFEEYGWDWTYHSYCNKQDKWFGWSLEHSRKRKDPYFQYVMEKTTDRKTAVLNGLKRNGTHIQTKP